jgi:hypothetical protein
LVDISAALTKCPSCYEGLDPDVQEQLHLCTTTSHFQKQPHVAGGLHALMLILIYDFMLLRLLDDQFFTAFTT